MRQIALAVLLAAAACPVQSATRSETEELAKALGLPEVVKVMRDEGLVYANDMAEQLLAGRAGASWDLAVDAIYDPAKMQVTVIDTMADMLADTDITPLLDFFTSQRGREIIAYEVSAREALMDTDVEEAAKERLALMRAADSPELRKISRFVEVNDLVESNVMGAMNSNYAFYEGLASGGALGKGMSESEIVADVWAQEDRIREDTDTWVHAYLAMAYKPLSDADLDAYIAISEAPEGQAMNRALFEGFDRMYIEISHALGVAAAEVMSGTDL